ncbi:MAG: glycerophosphodiester phosphodiesterase family protein [Bacteroidota bacterium]|nr:glycerophosphodiester phosphodiesterase family protein [Bacteroidota bacterium]
MKIPGSNYLRSFFMIASMLFVRQNELIAQPDYHYMPAKIGWHDAVYDDNRKDPKLVPWTTWNNALEREMNWYLRAPVNEHGYPSYVYITFMDEKYQAYRNDFIPATQNGMGIISYLKYWEYQGKSNPKVMEVAKKMGDYLVKEANTPDSGVYPNFTRSTGINTDFPLKQSSQGDANYGKDVIEPDKGGLAGFALLELYKVTKEKSYFDQAIHNARILVRNMRKGDALHSPWPFRVDASTGKYWGERSGNMVYNLRLFDGLIAMGYPEFKKSREALWSWITGFQFKAPDDKDKCLWIQFFEDMPKEDNRNAWAPLNMARYLIEKRDTIDPQWKEHAEQCIQFAVRNFGMERPGGVTCVGEQDTDRRAWGGINSTFGAVAAMFYAAGGGDQYREMAFRNLSWMTYFIREDGIVCDQTGEWSWLREGGWQEDCHTDVIHNFMDALKAVPEWANSKTPDGKVRMEAKDFFPKPRNGKMYVIAHRGAHVGIPENSLPAIQKAIDLGCDFVEIDTRLTKDGRIVSVHNATIDQYVIGKTGKVSDYTLAELKQMSIGEKLGPDWKNTQIPTIEEILQLCRGQIGIYLDLKEPLVPELLQIIHKYDMERDIIWYIPASHMEIIKQLKSLCYKCVPMPDPGQEKNIGEVVNQVHPQVLASDMGQLNESFVKTAHAIQAKVFVDENKGTPEEWQQIINWGTDGIQTDDPAALIEFLKNRKE